MATNYVDPVTGIVIPTPTQEPGPQYAYDISNALATLAHLTHTGPGNSDGYQIPTAGLNINADLSMQSNNLVSSRSNRFVSQSAPISSSGDLNCIYTVNGNLFFNNGSGTAVQITSGSTIDVTTSVNLPETSTSINLTLPSNSPYVFISVNSSSGPITITLPSSGSVAAGRLFYVKDTAGTSASNNITVHSSGDTYDGASSYVLAFNYGVAAFVADGVSSYMVMPFFRETYNSGETVTFNAGSTLNIDGYQNFNSGSLITVALGSYLNVDGYETFLSGSNLVTNSGSTITVNSGTNYNTAIWPSWNTAQTRTLSTALNQAIVIAGTWTVSSAGFITDTTGPGTLLLPLNRLHNGGTLTSATFYFKVYDAHSGGAPLDPPRFGIYRQASNQYVASALNNQSGTFGGIYYSSGYAYFYQPGSVTSGSVYYNSGTVQAVTYVPNQNNVIDNTTYNYYAYILDESNTNSASGNIFLGMSVTCGNITNQSWSI